MTNARVIMASLLVATAALCGWSPHAYAAPGSWVPSLTAGRAHSKLAPALEHRGDSMSSPVVVRVSGDDPSDLRAAVEGVGGTVRSAANGSLLAWISPDELAPLSDDLVLLDSGLDSLCLAIIVARLEDALGIDPFNSADDGAFPVTVGDFIRLYEDARH